MSELDGLRARPFLDTIGDPFLNHRPADPVDWRLREDRQKVVIECVTIIAPRCWPHICRGCVPPLGQVTELDLAKLGVDVVALDLAVLNLGLVPLGIALTGEALTVLLAGRVAPDGAVAHLGAALPAFNGRHCDHSALTRDSGSTARPRPCGTGVGGRGGSPSARSPRPATSGWSQADSPDSRLAPVGCKTHWPSMTLLSNRPVRVHSISVRQSAVACHVLHRVKTWRGN